MVFFGYFAYYDLIDHNLFVLSEFTTLPREFVVGKFAFYHGYFPGISLGPTIAPPFVVFAEELTFTAVLGNVTFVDFTIGVVVLSVAYVGLFFKKLALLNGYFAGS